MEQLPFIKLFGVKVTTAKEADILKYITSHLQKKSKTLFITTPNPEFIMYARSHPEFKRILNDSDIALPDGVGISICAWLMGKGRVPRIAGVDMVEKLCSELSKSPYSTGFYGGQTRVAEQTSKCLQKKYSGLKVSYASDAWDHKKMTGKTIDVLFVAMGFPKQEKWIHENLGHVPVRVAMGVGGSFDFIAGIQPRAPKFVRSLGFEWLYRLIRQPWRIKRQLALVSFSLLTFKEMFTSRFSKTS